MRRKVSVRLPSSLFILTAATRMLCITAPVNLALPERQPHEIGHQRGGAADGQRLQAGKQQRTMHDVPLGGADHKERAGRGRGADGKDRRSPADLLAGRTAAAE